MNTVLALERGGAFGMVAYLHCMVSAQQDLTCGR